MAERAYFHLCLALGRLLRSARYSRSRVVFHDVVPEVRKRRAFYAPVLIWMSGLPMKVMDTGVRVLGQRDWEQRERWIYQTLYGTSVKVESDGTLVLPFIHGRTLAAMLEDPDLEEGERQNAIESAVVALAEFHQHGFTHADAMAENVFVDLVARPGSPVARPGSYVGRPGLEGRHTSHWFDFETIHDATRSVLWRRADDLRALVSTCLLRTLPDKGAATLKSMLDTYADNEVVRVMAANFTSVWRRSLAFHLAQAGLSFESFQRIGLSLSQSFAAQIPGRQR